jgi:hypothetical protein
MGRRVQEVRKSILKYSVYYKHGLDPEVKDLLLNLLKHDPYTRLTIDQILKHPAIYPIYSKIMKTRFPDEEPLLIDKEKECIEKEIKHKKVYPEKKNSSIQTILNSKTNVKEEKIKRISYNNLAKKTTVDLSPIRRITTRQDTRNNLIYLPRNNKVVQRQRTKSRKIIIKHDSNLRKIKKNAKMNAFVNKVESNRKNNLLAQASSSKRINKKRELIHKSRVLQLPIKKSLQFSNKKFQKNNVKNINLDIYKKVEIKQKPLKYSFEPQPSHKLNSRNKFIKSKKKLLKKNLKSQSSVLHFEDYPFGQVHSSYNHKETFQTKPSSPLIEKQTFQSMFNTMITPNYSPTRVFKTESIANSLERVSYTLPVETSTTLRKYDIVSPEIYSPERISSYLYAEKNLIKKKKFKSIIKRQKSISLAEQVKQSKIERQRRQSKNIQNLKSSVQNVRKTESNDSTNLLLSRNKTQKIQLSRALDLNPMSKTLKKLKIPKIEPEGVKIIRNNENEMLNQPIKNRRKVDRFEEFKRMRSPQKRSLFDEYKEKMKKNKKPISLNTYYKIPKNSFYLRKKKKKNKKKN